MMRQLYFFLTALLLFSCQSEENFEQIEDSSSISSQSELSELILRLTQNPTAFDDFIDDSNALRLNFPFEVSLNSENDYIITDFEDYQALIDDISAQQDAYSLNISFPTEVSFTTYETQVIQNASEFEAISAAFQGSSEINCLEYEFPMTINVFDTQNNFTTSRTLQNRAQFHNYIRDLKVNSGFYELDYPLPVQINGSEEILSSNIDLLSAIESLDESCFLPSLLNTTSRLEDFIAFLTDGQFQITTLIDDDDDNLTALYQDLRFIFTPDNNILVENIDTNASFSGSWEAEIDEGLLELELSFEDDDLLEELEEDWIVNAFGNPNNLNLTDDDDEVEQTVLIFEKL